jgi:hypothetical protein
VVEVFGKRDFSRKGLVKAFAKAPKTLAAIRRVKKDLKRNTTAKAVGYGGSAKETLDNRTFDDLQAIFGDKVPKGNFNASQGKEKGSISEVMDSLGRANVKDVWSDDLPKRHTARQNVSEGFKNLDLGQRDAIEKTFLDMTKRPERAIQVSAGVGAGGAGIQYAKGVLLQKDIAKSKNKENN